MPHRIVFPATTKREANRAETRAAFADSSNSDELKTANRWAIPTHNLISE